MDDLFQLGASLAEEEEDTNAGAALEEKKIDGPAPHLVEALCAAISRMAQGQTLYSADNKLVKLMRERVEDAWRLINVNGEGIQLDIQPEGKLVYHDIVVFQQPERDTIATRLYQDGIRRLSFGGTMDVSELVRFVSIFDRSEEWQAESDCADRIWILNLKGLRHHVVDGFDDLNKETRGHAAMQTAAALSQFTGEAGALEELDTGQPSSALQQWGQTRRSGVDAGGLEVLHREVVGEGLEPAMVDAFWGGLTDNGPLFDQFLQMASYVATVPEVGIGQEDVDRLMERMVRQILILDEDDLAVRIERFFKAPEPVGAMIRRAWQEVADPRFLTELMTSSPNGSGRQKALAHLMERYLRPEPQDLVESVIRNPELPSVGSLIELLHQTEPQALAYWMARFDEIPDKILRMMVEHLDPEEIQKPVGRKFLTALWKSSSPTRLELACRLTPDHFLPKCLQQLQTCIEEPIEGLRIEAARALRRLNDPRSGIYVLTLLRHAKDKKLSPAEIRELLHTLMVVGGDRYIPFLEQCLGELFKPTQGLFGLGGRPVVVVENPLGDHEVIRALVRHGSPRALAVVKTVFNHGDPSIKTFIGVVRQNPEAEPQPHDEDGEAPASRSAVRARGPASRPVEGMMGAPAPSRPAPSRPAPSRSAPPVGMMGAPVGDAAPSGEQGPPGAAQGAAPPAQGAPGTRPGPAPGAQQRPAPPRTRPGQDPSEPDDDGGGGKGSGLMKGLRGLIGRKS